MSNQAFTAADTNRVSYRYLLEDPNGFGITPAEGKPRELRTTGNGITASKETKTSEEIRSDRMTANLIETAASSAGDVKGELSFGTYDDFLAAALFGVWSRPLSGDRFGNGTVAVASASTLTITGKDRSAYFVAGRRWKLEGFLDEANNRYVQVAAVAYDAGTQTTTVTVTANDLVAEAGNQNAVLLDANDVLVLGNTNIRAGTAGAAAFDSNGTNAFAAAVAAGQIKVGQFLAFEGLGRAVGTVTFDANPAADSIVTIDDGARNVTFQIGGFAQAGRTTIELGATAADTAANLVAAIKKARSQGQISVGVSLNTDIDPIVTVTNLLGNGGVLSGAGANLTIVDFAGGSSARGVYEVTSVSDDVIGVSPAPGTDANAGGVGVTVKGSMLRNPSQPQDFVKQSFSMETSYEDVQQHFTTRGLTVDTIEVSFSAGEIANFSSNLKGTDTARHKDQLSKLNKTPYTPLDTTVTDTMNATTNVGDITKNGEALVDGIRTLSLSFANNLREQRTIGSKFPRGIGAGRLGLTGKVEAYFSDGELYDQFIEHVTVNLGWSLTDVDENHYVWTVPALKISNNPISAQAGNQDVMQNLDFEAIRDPNRDCQIQVDRFSSLKPVTA